jgi:cyclopropane fatty-acyl-phospholipid synthase-like methyltransferase
MSELERWESRFSAPGFWFGTAPNNFLRSQAHRLRAGQTALSIADGEGRNGVWLAEQGLDVLSIDFAPTALRKAQALATERGVVLRTEQADLTRWTWPQDRFDVIIGIFIQFLTSVERPRIFASMKHALKPGGWILIQGYRPEQLKYKTGGPSDITQLYTRAMLEDAFGDLSFLEVNEHDSEISEGCGHVGMSALIDLAARK